MNLEELLDKIKFQIDYVDKVDKQINILKIIKFKKYEQQTEEEVVTYDANELFDDFSFKINQATFFLKRYLEIFDEILLSTELFKQNNISICPDVRYEQMVYYFDAFISSISSIVEAEQKAILLKYLNSKNIEKIYPNRNKFGLWWQIYMLRNRILHTTEERFDGNKEICSRYIEFSPKLRIVAIKENKISFLSTLLDIYKDENVKKEIEKSIKNHDNPFDNLFNYKSAKGKGKKNPRVLYIDNDIYFDYVISGCKLIDEVLDLFNLINQVFLEEFSKYYNDKNEICKIKTSMNSSDDLYEISDVFDKLA